MNKNQEKIKTALERIDNALESINSDEDWLKYLCFQSRFYNYSFGNAMLIYSQNPQATYVKGFKAWNQLGRYVKKGATGLAILAPCIRKEEVFKEPENKAEYHDAEGEKEVRKVVKGFRVAYVFDIADTDGDDSQIPILVKGLAGNSEEEKLIYERLYAFISREHTIEEVTGTASKGSFNLESKVISVRADLEYLQKVKTLLHEYAHLKDFEMHPEETISRNRRELIAESVAFVVSLRLGLDTSRYSMSYIQSWLKDKDELKQIADTVQKISYHIITELAESSDSAFSMLKEQEEEES
ncbi:MAG: ArdC-like ssDNA-binding domain-containing protein [Lachnospiraceae bacterium]|nr:ArdC-like ssDNA-binding domain-containing protein [Lachnospiraceae bacterium]